MNKKELYDSAYGKINKLYELIFDDNGYLKSEFNLTDEEIEAFRGYSDNLDDGKKRKLEILFGGIIYNKYTFKSELTVKNIFELGRQIDLISRRKDDLSNVYARQAYNWDGNVLFATTGHLPYDKYYSVKIGLYNLEGASEYEINLQQERETSMISGKINIVREKRRVASSNVQFYIWDSGIESYDINQILSKECIDVLLVAEKELSQILSNLLQEKESYEKGSTGFRRR